MNLTFQDHVMVSQISLKINEILKIILTILYTNEEQEPKCTTQGDHES